MLGIGCIPISSGFLVSRQQSREKILIGSKLRASVSSEEIRMRLITQLEKLREKDRQAKSVSKDVSTAFFATIAGSVSLDQLNFPTYN